jgi:tetratricopeptide (TPR) repeat protein
MTDHDRGGSLAKRAFDLWQRQGLLEEAAECYREALPLLDLDHYWTPTVYGEYASVLASLGRSDEARLQSQKHLEVELRLDPSGLSPSVVIARYFLAQHAILCGDPAGALEALKPSADTSGKLAPAVNAVRAEALSALGRREEAIGAAHLALSSSRTKEQRGRIRERLRETLGSNWDAG